MKTQTTLLFFLGASAQHGFLISKYHRNNAVFYSQYVSSQRRVFLLQIVGSSSFSRRTRDLGSNYVASHREYFLYDQSFVHHDWHFPYFPEIWVPSISRDQVRRALISHYDFNLSREKCDSFYLLSWPSMHTSVNFNTHTRMCVPPSISWISRNTPPVGFQTRQNHWVPLSVNSKLGMKCFLLLPALVK